MPDAGGGIGGKLGEKVGGIPVWGYGVGAVAGAGGFILYKRRASQAASTAGASGTSAQSQLDAALGSTLGGMSAGDAVPIIIPAPTTQNTGIPDNGSSNGTSTGTGGAASTPAPVSGGTSAPGSGATPAASSPQFVAQGGSYYVVAWDLYGPAAGVGDNEIAAYASAQGKGVITPDQVKTWNVNSSKTGDGRFFNAGTLVYVGNAGWSAPKVPTGGYGVGK